VIVVSFRKLLFVMLVIIVLMFGLMLTTSYAWYSYENASTKFDVNTADEDITVNYLSNKYINTAIAIPLTPAQIEQYSEKCIFTINVDSKRSDNAIMASVYLKDVEIEDELKDKNLKIELYYQGNKIGMGIDGTKLINGSDILIDSVILEGYTDNLFEVRVYILDDNTNQSAMMGKSFKGTVEVKSIYRMGNLDDFNNNSEENDVDEEILNDDNSDLENDINNSESSEGADETISNSDIDHGIYSSNNVDNGAISNDNVVDDINDINGDDIIDNTSGENNNY